MRIAGVIKKLLSGDGKLRLIVALGALGMALVLLSALWPKERTEVDSATAQFTSGAYVRELEGELTALITGIEGVGRARVMVTLANGVEYLYAKEERLDTDTTREQTREETATRVHEKERREETFLLVDQNGQRRPLLQTEVQPRVQGVVIVCDGADDPVVQLTLTSVITTALDIPSNKVYVAKIDTD